MLCESTTYGVYVILWFFFYLFLLEYSHQLLFPYPYSQHMCYSLSSQQLSHSILSLMVLVGPSQYLFMICFFCFVLCVCMFSYSLWIILVVVHCYVSILSHRHNVHGHYSQYKRNILLQEFDWAIVLCSFFYVFYIFCLFML